MAKRSLDILAPAHPSVECSPAIVREKELFKTKSRSSSGCAVSAHAWLRRWHTSVTVQLYHPWSHLLTSSWSTSSGQTSPLPVLAAVPLLLRSWGPPARGEQPPGEGGLGHGEGRRGWQRGQPGGRWGPASAAPLGQHLGGLCFSAWFSQGRNRRGDGRKSFLEKRATITSPVCAVLTVIAN